MERVSQVSAPGAVPGSKPRTWEKLTPYLLLLPAAAFVILFKIYPMIKVVISSFIRRGEPSIMNYRILFMDKGFWNSLWVTLKMNLIIIPLQVVLSFFVALLLAPETRRSVLVRTLIYLPVTMSITVASFTWQLMLNVNSGVVNSFLSLFGIPPQGFFADPNQALGSIIVMATWKGVGIWMMYFIAGLKGIDEELYESAFLDGAGFFARLHYITLPLLRRTTLFVVVANTTANMLLFAPSKIITKGGPAGRTNVLMYEVYKSAFRNGNMARAGAITSILLLLVLLTVIGQFKLLRSAEDD